MPSLKPACRSPFFGSALVSIAFLLVLNLPASYYQYEFHDLDPKVLAMIKEHGMIYYDMIHELPGFDCNNYDFYADDLHLSPQGAAVYSKDFAQFLTKIAVFD